MKITILLTFLTLVNAMGSIYPQSKPMNLSMKDVTVLEVFNSIENQSKYRFFYQNEQININRKVDINIEQASIEDILNTLFANEKVKFHIFDENLIVLTSEMAQQTSVSGKVTSIKDGSALPGVNIIEKGTTNGVITDIEGNYTITVKDANAVLVFSFVGYKAVEIPINNQSVIDIKLEEEISQLDEVVVVGYGMQKKSLVTGSISSVKSDDIQNTSVTRPEQALMGKTSGVQVIPSNGSPGAGMNVRIRGYSSNGNSNPIFIVDGIKNMDIAYLDPNDIASMEVLKDAASSAIYGAEGGNGVIIITTKKGKSGKIQVNYDFQNAWQSTAKLPELMNSSQYAQYMNEAGLIASANQTYDTNWLDEIFETGKLQKHHLTFSGGNENSTYLLSLSYLKNDGIIVGSKDNYERYSIRLNSDHKMAKWLKIGNSINYSHYTRNAINETSGEFGGVISSALQMDPTTPIEYTGAIPATVQDIIDAHPTVVKAPSGNYYGISPYVFGEIWNPFVNMAITNGGVKRDNINGNFYAELTPVKGLTFISRVGLDLAYQNNHYWNPTYYYTNERSNGSTLVVDNNDMYSTIAWENYATYTQTIANHSFTVLAGMSAEKYQHRNTNAQGGPMIVEQPSYSELDFLSSTENNKVNGQLEQNRKLSYFGRLSYDYMGKYLLQGSLRRDGAGLSQLPKNNRWGTFPSFSAGWVVSKENFFPQAGPISFVKLRGSWGQNGSLSNLGKYQYAALITATSSGSTMQYPLSDGTWVTVMEPQQAPNPNLKWETSQQTDIGFDIRAFEDKLSFSFDYFKKTTKDLITPNSASFSVGNYVPPINGGDVENTGLEFDLGYKNSIGGLKYAVNVNLSTLKNKVTYLNPLLSRISGSQVGTGWNATMFEEGQPIFYFYGYKTNGIDQVSGDPIFITKDGTETNADGVTTDDMQFIGNPIPKMIFGGNISLEYKGFDFSTSFSGMSGNKVMMGWIRNDRNTVNRPTYFFDDRWTASNTSGSKPKANTNTKTWNSDQIVFNGSFLRIQQIQFGYSLPVSLVNKAKINAVRLYVSLENFFLITNYPGMDPQASPQNQNNNLINSNGIDRGTYPTPKSLMLGASITF